MWLFFSCLLPPPPPLVLLLLLLFIIFVFLSGRTRSKREPPLDKGLIPWLGHALEFGKDAAKFLTRMKEKHGDIFTVRVAGRYVTVLLDPHSYDDVLHNSTSLDFSRYAQVLMERIFHLRLPHYDPAAERAAMHKHFQGESLAHLNAAMYGNLRDLLESDALPERTAWKRDGLFNFSYSLLFRAGYRTLFGAKHDGTNGLTDIYDAFRTFDGLLTKMARTTLKPEEKREAESVRRRLWNLLSPARSGEGVAPSAWLQGYLKHLEEDGTDQDTCTRALLLQLWATQMKDGCNEALGLLSLSDMDVMEHDVSNITRSHCGGGNVGPAAFWLLGFLLTNPRAMKAVKKEFAGIPVAADVPENLILEKLQHTPVFDGTLSETLRLTAAPFVTREVLASTTLHMANGQEYDFRQGDRVCLFPFLSPQMDPEIYDEPEKFKFDRFLNADGTEKREFFKGGQRLKYYTMPWGAGRNACVGRHFAIGAIKQFVFLVLSRLDLELCDPESLLPPVNPSRYGFGMLQPDGDVLIRYKLRDLL